MWNNEFFRFWTLVQEDQEDRRFDREHPSQTSRFEKASSKIWSKFVLNCLHFVFPRFEVCLLNKCSCNYCTCGLLGWFWYLGSTVPVPVIPVWWSVGYSYTVVSGHMTSGLYLQRVAVMMGREQLRGMRRKIFKQQKKSKNYLRGHHL